MNRTNRHIKKAQWLVFLLAVLIALTPCIIKESLLDSFDLTFERPLNKNKSTQSFNPSCVTEMQSQAQTAERSMTVVTLLPQITKFPLYWALPEKTVLKKQSKKASGNSPPIYILYKRLKFDMA